VTDLALLLENPQVVIDVSGGLASEVLSKLAVGRWPPVSFSEFSNGFQDARPHCVDLYVSSLNLSKL